jgi:hypothetical protein
VGSVEGVVGSWGECCIRGMFVLCWLLSLLEHLQVGRTARGPLGPGGQVYQQQAWGKGVLASTSAAAAPPVRPGRQALEEVNAVKGALPLLLEAEDYAGGRRDWPRPLAPAGAPYPPRRCMACGCKCRSDCFPAHPFLFLFFPFLFLAPGALELVDNLGFAAEGLAEGGLVAFRGLGPQVGLGAGLLGFKGGGAWGQGLGGGG